jgi:hypothetical protein
MTDSSMTDSSMTDSSMTDSSMTDPAIPQTKFAQRLEPYRGVVPSYVLEMDEVAKAAGLSVRHRHIVRGSMLIAYAGTREQVAACALVKDPANVRWPCGTNKPTRRAIDETSPSGLARGCLFKIGDSRYCIQYVEMVPERTVMVAEGIERFDFRIGDDSERNVFVGTREALIARGIAGPDMFSDDPAEKGRLSTGISPRSRTGAHLLTLEKSRRLRGDKWAYTQYPAAIRRHKGEEAEMVEVGSAEEWLEYVEDRLGENLAGGAARAITPVRTKNGRRFVVSARHIVEINQRIEAVLQGIRKLEMKTEAMAGPMARTTSHASPALEQADSRFKAIMQSLFGRHLARPKSL